jgi:uncharacterized protein (DUF2141 family)
MRTPPAAPRRRLAALALALLVALAACTGAPPVDGDTDPGALAVLVSGLPSGAAGDVTVSGPNGFSDAISASETYAGLTPGSYAVAAASVAVEGVTFAATVAGSPAAVPAGGLATATVSYAATSTAPGTLTVTITGLPDGVDATVNVTGPDGFDEDLTASATFTGVAPGTYTVTALDVDDAGDAYAASVGGSPATVPAGGAAAAVVSYAFLDPSSFGTLQVDVVGLPSGADADVAVAGPGGFTADLTESATLSGIVVGTYTVSADSVAVGDLTYAPVVSGSPALVLGAATTTATVLYQPFVPNDGDAASNPGLFAKFRATSPGPVWVDGLLFNAASPIDTKGIQLRDRLGQPADPGDWLAFELVHGQGNTTTITISLECSNDATPTPIRAELRDDDGAKIGLSVNCNTSRDIAVPNVGGAGDYVVHVLPVGASPYFTEYTLSIDAYCFQACAYQPFEP